LIFKGLLMLDNSLTSTIITNRAIANYRLVELKGSGGMANVYKAIQLSLERPVALKVMHPHLQSNEAFIARFEKEAKRAAMLQHENIVSIIDYGSDNGEYYIAMEFIDGISLSEMLKKQPRMPLEISLYICHQVAEGLKYAHSMNIIHRDIKPANILLSIDGRVLITDFGIAKAGGDLSITSTGQVIGSPAYMSPEQAAGKTLDHRSDLFSLGIILYETISGERPFKGETYQYMVTSIMSDLPQPLGELRTDVNPEINSLVQKALIKPADSRFQSADDFSEAVFTQLDNFKIPSGRKMMAEYLKNPIKVTQKLRADKISDHLESALYFLAVGEGILAEARREFQDVLRFDKNNNEAKKHLSRLESHLNGEKSHKRFIDRRLNIGISYWLAIVAITVLIFSVVSLMSPENSPIQQPSMAMPSIVINTTPDKELLSFIPESQKTDAAKKEIKKTRLSDGKFADSMATMTATTLSHPDVTAYNYPDQSMVRYGTLKVLTDILARMRIDSQDYSWTNGPPVMLSPGRHIIIVSADNLPEIKKRVYIIKGQSDTLKINLGE
jgi:serine/threonine protein kinase